LKENKDWEFAIVRWKYDEQGNKVEERYFGTDEQLKENKFGFAIIRLKYDEQGHLVKTIFLNRREEIIFEK